MTEEAKKGESQEVEKETTQPEKKTSSKKEAKEVSGLSDEDIKWREKYKLNLSEREAEKLAAEKEKQTLASKAEIVIKEKTVLERQLINAKIENAAITAGINDLEFVKLIDISNVKLLEDGKIDGIEKAINDLKERKPHFFGEAKKTSSSSNAELPGDTKKTAVNAWDQKKEEWNNGKRARQTGKF